MFRAFRPFVMVCVLLSAFAAQAQSARDRQEPAQASDARDPSLPASVRRVERETGGEVIRAEPVRRDGREVYNLKVLTPNGRVRVVQEDPGQRADPRAAREPRREDARRDEPRREPQRREEPRREPRQERPRGEDRPPQRGDDGFPLSP